MIAFAASFLCSALLGLRLTFPAFLMLMLPAAVGAAVTSGLLASAAVLIGAQTGYLCGALMRGLAPARPARPALRQVALRP